MSNKIEIPQGHVLDLENSDFECAEPYYATKPKRVTCFEDLGNITGYYVRQNDSSICGDFATDPTSAKGKCARNLWSTREQAEASVAMCQLTQHMKHINGDWVPDWSSSEDAKWCILLSTNKVIYSWYTESQKFLAFDSENKAKQFMADHADLIKQAAPLL